MSVQVSYKKQTLLGFILLLIIIGSVEISSRVYENIDPNCRFDDSDAFKKLDRFLQIQICLDGNYLKFLEHDDLVNVHESNQYMSTININSDGFRGQEIKKDKGETYRIIFVGGSTAFGSGSTSDETTIPGFLQKEISNYGFSSNIEVINAGVSGYSSIEEKYLIENYLLKYEPDLFIIYDGLNDLNNSDGLTEIFDDDGNTVEIYQIKEKNTQINQFKFKNFPQYRTPFVINQILFNSELNLPHTYFNESMVSPWKDRWSHICDLGKTEGFNTIITVQPILGSSERTFNYNGATLDVLLPYLSGNLETLDGFVGKLPELDNHCLQTIDLTNVLDNINEPIYLDRGHMTDFGNEIIAKKLFDEIKENLNKQIIKSNGE